MLWWLFIYENQGRQFIPGGRLQLALCVRTAGRPLRVDDISPEAYGIQITGPSFPMDQSGTYIGVCGNNTLAVRMLRSAGRAVFAQDKFWMNPGIAPGCHKLSAAGLRQSAL
jgi:hypothetical protein